MIEDLINSGKIDIQSANIYRLFTLSALGVDVLKSLEETIFMEEPLEKEYAYSEGRKSVIRDFKKIITGLNNLLSESHNE